MKKLSIFLVALVLANGAIAQWSQQYALSSGNLLSVFFTDANTGYAVGDSGRILKTSNAGTTWTALSSGTTANLHSICFTSTDTGYVAGGNQYQSGVILKTTNGGTTWNTLSSGITFPLRSVYFTDANTGYVVGDSSSIIKTIDGGATWAAEWTGMTSDLTLSSVYFPNSNKGYAAGGQTFALSNGTLTLNVLLMTEDGGTTWGDPQIGSYGSLNSVFCPDPNTCYAVGGNLPYRPPFSEIVKMTNGAEDITIQISKSNGALCSVFFPDASTGYAVGVAGTILKTTNGGADWTTQNSGTSTTLRSVFFTDANTGYAVGGGVILKTTNGGNALGIDNRPSNDNSLKIYPNPSSGSITVETPAKGQLFVINNSSQQLVTRPITGAMTQLDISNLPTGVYFVKAVGEKGIQVGKFVKQ